MGCGFEPRFMGWSSREFLDRVRQQKVDRDNTEGDTEWWRAVRPD